MLQYLSPEWIAAVNTHARSNTELIECAQNELVLQQVVTGAPEGASDYTIRLAANDVSLTPGRSPVPDVTFLQDYPTAVAIYLGRLNALDGVQSGRIEVRGDSARLAQHQRALLCLQKSFQAVRTETDVPG